MDGGTIGGLVAVAACLIIAGGLISEWLNLRK